MTYDSKAIQARLIRDLEPVVAVELDRHLKFKKIGIPMSMYHGLKAAILLDLSTVMHGKQKIHASLLLHKTP
jgi:hypothetical protein